VLSVTRLLGGEVRPGDVLRYEEARPPHLLHFAPEKRPVVVWNLTAQCNLHCMHCYASARTRPLPGELTTVEGERLLDDLADMGVPVVLFSGGEPLMRPDIFHLAAYARRRGLRTVLSTNGTLVDAAMARRIADAGFSYVGVSLDGLEAVHDRVRGQRGAFRQALQGLSLCRRLGLRVGIRFTVHRKNVDQLPHIFDLAEAEGIDRLCVYHLAYAGRGEKIRHLDLSPWETRQVVDYIFRRAEAWAARSSPVEVLTVDNHADNAYLLMWVQARHPERAEEVHRLLLWNGGNQSGVAVASIDPLGHVCIDQFSWHRPLGNVRERPFSSIWNDDRHPLLKVLRQRPRPIEGRCRHCRFLPICNGNLRVRAESYFGHFLAPDPACYLTDWEIGLSGQEAWEEARRWPVPVQEVA
jgi:radical SAM protein with 4Fe4S-binding SPASM domain